MLLGKTRKYEDCHRIKDEVLEKLCSICGDWLPCTDKYFYKNKLNGQDGLYPYCKKCSIQRTQQYRTNNPGYLESQDKKRYKTIRNKKILRSKDWNKKNRDHCKEMQKIYRQTHPEKMKEYNEKRLLKNHKISKQEWIDCKNYFGNSCAYCGKTEEDVKEQQGQRLHKEHVIDCGRNDLKNCIPKKNFE